MLGNSRPLTALARNLRYSARSFARTPVTTVALVITIAVGVGSNAAVQGFNRGLITRDMPSVATDGVVSLFTREASRDVAPLSAEDFIWLSSHAGAFEWLGAARELQGSVQLSGREDDVSIAAITAPIARLLGLPVAGGAVISDQLWQSAFDGRADMSAARIRIDDRDTRVTGVAPEWLDGLYLGRTIDVWMPLGNEALGGADRSSKTLSVIGRLRSGVSADQALASVQARTLSSGVIAMAPYTGVAPEIADGLTRVHALLGLAAGTVFLIVCANVASFLLARASARSRETSVRVALGARRAQLVAQLLSDSVIIAVAGAAFGVLLAVWTSRIVPALLFESDASQLVFVPDRVGVAVAASLCAGLTVVCGLTPLLELRHDRPAIVLRRESMGPSVATSRLRAALVVVEMTACCVLVISTGLLLQTFRNAVQTAAGRRFSHSILGTVQAEVPDDIEYFRDVEAAARKVATRAPMAWVARPPGSRPTWRSFRIEPPPSEFRDVTLDVQAFTPETLERIVLPPTAGRLFGGSDGPGSCRVAVVNVAAADQLFDGDAIGSSIVDPTDQRVEIIGVVTPRADVRPLEPTTPAIYYYPGQTKTPFDRTGPARFRIGVARERVTAILDANIVSRSYFDGVGSSTIAGHVFTGSSAPRGCRVGVINQETAEQYFGGDAVGGAVVDPRGNRTEIVGVVSSATLGRFERRASPSIFFPMAQDLVHRMTLVIDAGEPSQAMIDTLRSRLEGVPGRKPNVPVVVESLDQQMARTALAPLHIAALLVRASAMLAVVLAVVGVYGALADAAHRRRREIGVRVALGAQAWRVIALIVGEGARLAALGATVGVLGAVGVERLLVRVAPGAASGTVQTWLAGPLLLLGVVVVASAVPALRALTVSPVRVLRDE